MPSLRRPTVGDDVIDTRHLVDPELWAVIDALPPMTFSYDTVGAVRQTIDSLLAGDGHPADDGVFMREQRVPGPPAGPEVPVLIYEPAKRDGLLPAVLFIHGGGYFCGRALQGDAGSRSLVRDVGCVVVAVDYRLAPETRFPGAIEDCYAVLLWVHGQAAALGIDPHRIAIEGVSAGGGLAAALTLMARDRGVVPVAFQFLLYPMLDDRTGSGGVPRSPLLGQFGWAYDGNAFWWEALLDKAAGGPDVSPYAAPARAEDLANLPATFVAAAALDALLIENVAYAMKLIAAGVSTELLVVPGAFHGFDAFDGGLSSIGDDFRDKRIKVLRRALSVTPRPAHRKCVGPGYCF